MQIVIAGFVGLLLSVGAGAEPVVEGQVRLATGEPVAGARVLVFDLADLRRYVTTTAEEDGRFVLSLSALGSRAALPDGFGLGQNYPNPFNPGTVIPYQLATAGYVRLEVFNVLGQRVVTLVDGEQAAGTYTTQWDARDASGQGVAAGVYIYRLMAGGGVATRRMLLVDGSAGLGKTSTSSVEPLSRRRTLDTPRAEPVEADPVYGLVVLGDGMAAYVDANFRVGLGPLAVEMQRLGRGKATQRVLVMGDVDNNGRVDYADALLVMAYSLDPSVVMPNGGDIKLGDVNGDGVTNMADAQLIVQQITDLSGPGVRPPEAGLLTIPPVTLTVGSSYTHRITKLFGANGLNPFFTPAYSVVLKGDNVVELEDVVAVGGYGYMESNGIIRLGVTRGGGLWRYQSVTITGISPGTAEVVIENSDFGDAQTISVTVVPRPVSILDMTLEHDEETIKKWTIGSKYRESPVAARIHTDADNEASYAIYELSMQDYLELSGLLEEAGTVRQEAWANIKQDLFLAILGLLPGLGLPTTLYSTKGDLEMYISIIDIARAIEKKSTKVTLQGLFANDGAIIPGNRYLRILMVKDKDDEDEVAGDFEVDLRLHVRKHMRIDSESVNLYPVETIDYGSFRVREWTGVQIVPLKFVTFAEEAGRELEKVEMWLSAIATGLHNQEVTYKVRKKGSALAVEWTQAQKDSFEEPNLFAMTFGQIEPLVLRSTDSFFLAATVRNRSEKVGSSPASLSYYCSTDPMISTDDQKLEIVERVEVEALDALDRAVKIVQLPAPRPEPRTGTEAPGTCWVSDRSVTAYYGACVSDEVDNDDNCSFGVPVQLQ